MLIPPLGLDLRALVRGYALFWFVIGDQVKLLACRAFHRARPTVLSKTAVA